MASRNKLIPRLVDLKVGATQRTRETIERFEACHAGAKPDRTQAHFGAVFRQWRSTREIHLDPDPVEAATKAALKYIHRVRSVGGGKCCPVCP